MTLNHLIIQVEQTLTDLSEKTSQNLQNALAVTAKNANALQRVAKKSVDQVEAHLKSSRSKQHKKSTNNVRH